MKLSVAEIETMDRAELIAAWNAVFKTPVPKRLSTPFLRRFLAFEMQTRARGGHATLVRASAKIRAAVDVFEPEAAPVAALTARLRAEFDPKGVLNPGRMG